MTQNNQSKLEVAKQALNFFDHSKTLSITSSTDNNDDIYNISNGTTLMLTDLTSSESIVRSINKSLEDDICTYLTQEELDMVCDLMVNKTYNTVFKEYNEATQDIPVSLSTYLALESGLTLDQFIIKVTDILGGPTSLIFTPDNTTIEKYYITYYP